MTASRSQRSTRHVARIVLVDDHPMVRERLQEVIQAQPDLQVCGEAEDRHHALKIIENQKPDLAIIDLSLKNSHGLDLIKDLQATAPNLAILVVSMHEESLHAERVIRAGARGYITKQQATKNILVAIRAVLRGEVYLSERTALRIAAKVARKPDAINGSSVGVLSDRELRVLELIGQGFGTRKISELLNVGVPTIETYRSRLKEKLNLKDASELLQFAIRHTQST
jgi:DNA-binding NarL/FixJ family response regulator